MEELLEEIRANNDEVMQFTLNVDDISDETTQFLAQYDETFDEQNESTGPYNLLFR